MPSNDRLPSSHDIIAKAVKFLQPLGEKYAEGSVSRAGLITLRNQMLEDEGLHVPRKGFATMKRPSAEMKDGEQALAKAAPSSGPGPSGADQHTAASSRVQLQPIPKIPMTMMDLWNTMSSQAPD